jgi:hypothetical protein
VEVFKALYPGGSDKFDLSESGVPIGVLAQGQTQGSMLKHRTNKTLTTGPFGNTCEADEVSPELDAGVVAGLHPKALSPSSHGSNYFLHRLSFYLYITKLGLNMGKHM